MYYILRKLKIPHVPKWEYDHNLKLSDNMTNRDKWKKKRLFAPDESDLLALQNKSD